MSAKTKLLRLMMVVVLLSATVTTAFQWQSVSAAQIVDRSLTLKSGATDGGSMASGVVNHEFKFTVPNAADGAVGSIKFQYCLIAAGTCDMPIGLVTNGGSTALDDEIGATGFTLDKSVNGSPFLTRSAVSVPSDTVLTYRLSNVTNPTAVNAAFFVRITTYTGIDGATGLVDSGVVTATTAEQIVLTGIMPESLIFCTGATVPIIGSVPDCGNATSGAINFNQLFSPTDTATATSQMAASTNAISGYAIAVFGPTLTSGSNIIAPMTVAGVGVRGSGQFGMNLMANTVTTSTIATGTDIAPTPNGTDLRGQPAAGYDTADTFKFIAGTAGDVVANSDYNVAGPTNAQIYTATYIVNVAGSQIAGTYTSTLTYVCTATF